MLTAKNSNNEDILSFSLSDEDLRTLSKEVFSCPCCKDRVKLKFGKKILKSGNKVIPHFSHFDSNCPNPKETEEHKNTKISIYNSLLKLNIPVHLEKTYSLNDFPRYKEALKEKIKALNKDLRLNDTLFGQLLERNIFRPDVICKYQNHKIAIEVQKSYLPEEDFLLRTYFYKIINFKVIWIIPRKLFLDKNKNPNKKDKDLHLNISDFHAELKKYCFGNIYTWDFNDNKLYVYKIENMKGYKKTGEWCSGEGGGQYFSEGGEIEFTYKKYKKLKLIYESDNILKNFSEKKILKNEKFNKIIDADLWLLNKK